MLCKDCIKQFERTKDTTCPVCRENFLPKERTPAHSIERDMRRLEVPCPTCSREIKLSQMKTHSAECGRTVDIPKFKPVAETSQVIPSNLPNRSTFKCPYCADDNLDSKGLREHCNKRHRHDHTKVVCPICSSMPWGDEHQQSGNFLEHLNLRHKFEYDTYVDYEQDDDVMLQQAI